jgi:hypothetical protein
LGKEGGVTARGHVKARQALMLGARRIHSRLNELAVTAEKLRADLALLGGGEYDDLDRRARLLAERIVAAAGVDLVRTTHVAAAFAVLAGGATRAGSEGDDEGLAESIALAADELATIERGMGGGQKKEGKGSGDGDFELAGGRCGARVSRRGAAGAGANRG